MMQVYSQENDVPKAVRVTFYMSFEIRIICSTITSTSIPRGILGGMLYIWWQIPVLSIIFYRITAYYNENTFLGIKKHHFDHGGGLSRQKSRCQRGGDPDQKRGETDQSPEKGPRITMKAPYGSRGNTRVLDVTEKALVTDIHVYVRVDPKIEGHHDNL